MPTIATTHHSLLLTTLYVFISSLTLNLVAHISASNSLSNWASASFTKNSAGLWRVSGRL